MNVTRGSCVGVFVALIMVTGTQLGCDPNPTPVPAATAGDTLKTHTATRQPTQWDTYGTKRFPWCTDGQEVNCVDQDGDLYVIRLPNGPVTMMECAFPHEEWCLEYTDKDNHVTVHGLAE
jgi:hypothetical protein